MPYEIQQTTIMLSDNPFSPIGSSTEEARITNEIYRDVIKHNSNSIVRCPTEEEKVYVTWKNQDLHGLGLQYYNRFIPPVYILFKKNVYKTPFCGKKKKVTFLLDPTPNTSAETTVTV